MRRPDARPKGIAVVWVALLLPVLIMFAGLTLDTGYVFLTGHQLQNAADAAALSGAMHLPDPASARNSAVMMGAANLAAQTPVHLDANAANASAGDVVVGQYDRATGQFTATEINPNAVKVVARRTAASPDGPLPLIFAPIFGIGTASVTRSAIAMSSGGSGGDFILLNRSAPGALLINGIAAVSAKEIKINSSDRKALIASGQVRINAPVLDIAGRYEFSGDVQVDGTLRTNQDPVADPLALLPVPPKGTNRNQLTYSNSGSITAQPGYYPNGIDLSGTGEITFSPGVYYVENNVKIGGSVRVRGSGVMLFVKSGDFTVNGDVDVRLSAPASGTYNGIGIFFDRGNGKKLEVNGDLTFSIDGVIYGKATEGIFNGTTSGYLARALILDRAIINGNISLDLSGNVSPSNSRSFLVQ